MSDKYLRSEAQNLVNGIGTEQSWGWSPAINFVDILPLRALTKLVSPVVAESSPEVDHGASCSEKGAAATSTESCKPQQTPEIPLGGAPVVDELDLLLAKSVPSLPARTAALGGPNDVHILLCGSCDIRHVFRTLAAVKVLHKARRLDGRGAPESTLHFHFYETNLRVHARHVFFLQWLCDALFSFDKLEDQVAMFLEVFGNALLRDITAAQAKDVAQRALRTMGYQEGSLSAMISFDEMKAKERDFVEDQIRHWTKSTSEAHIEKDWNLRLRTAMAERYDNKDNIIDWDFNFHLYEYTNAIKFPEYRTWRNTGVAFDYCHINPRKGFQYEYTQPNKTLCHFDRRGRGSYCGDIMNGPFYGVGIDTRNALLRPRNVDGTLKYGNGVTAMHNVRAWLYEIMCGKEWPWADHAFAWDDASNYNYLPPGTPSDVEYHASLPRAKFHFIGLDFDRFALHHAEERRPKFDAAFVGTGTTHLLGPRLLNLMANDAVVVCETAKFIVDCHDEAKERYVAKILDAAKSGRWEQDREKTSQLHRDQPEPRKIETVLSDAQKRSQARFMFPFHVALKSSSSSGDAEATMQASVA